ncbi:MAG: hypothetical protein ACXVEF_22830 [Polyangiales bacterium]
MNSRLSKMLLPAAQAAVVVTIAFAATRTLGPHPKFDDTQLRIFDDATFSILFALGLGFGLIRFGKEIRTFLEKIPRIAFDAAFFAIAFGITYHVTWAAFGAWPQIQDEISYDLLGRRIASGHPVLPSHPLSEFHHIRFYVDDGREYPLFQIGWPLVIAFFYKLHAPSMAPAFAMATLVVFTSKLGERLYGRITGILAGALVMSSGFMQVVGGAFFAHAWSAALIVLPIERLVAAFEDEGSPRRANLLAAIAGLGAAWCVLTRLPAALTLFFCLIALVAVYAVEWSRKPKLIERMKKPLLVFTACAALGPLGQMGWNLATTRKPFELPQTRYFNQTEMVEDCHRLGFGKGVGCPREHPPPDSFPNGYTFDDAVKVTEKRWTVFRNDAWGTVWPMALVGLFVARRPRKRDAIVLIGTFGPIAVYFGFYYHAIQHGARLWADLMGCGSVLVATGAASMFDEKEDPQPGILRRMIGAAAIGILILTMTWEFAHDIPTRVKDIARMRQAEKVQKNLDQANVHDALVYVQNCIDPDRGDVVFGWASTLNATPREAGDRWIMRDWGPEHDRQMVTMYPNKNHVRVDCNGSFLEKLDRTPRPELLVTEMEAKFPPDTRKDCYAILRVWPDASNRAVLEIRSTAQNSWARFRQYIFEQGNYEITAVVGTRPDGGKLQLAIDGTPLETVVDTKGLHQLGRFVLGTRALSPGTHTIEVRNLAPFLSYLSIDRLEYKKVP